MRVIRHPRDIDYDTWGAEFEKQGLGQIFNECREVMPEICRRRIPYTFITLYACSGEEQTRNELGPQIQKMNECIGAKLEEVIVK